MLAKFLAVFYLYKCIKCDRSIVCKNLDVTVADCGVLEEREQ